MTTSSIKICGVNKSDCGYCSRGSSETFGLLCNALSTKEYSKLLNCSFRRCGTYFYKQIPELPSCCPYYTIRSKVNEFKVKKSHKKLLKKVMKQLSSQGDYGVVQLKDSIDNIEKLGLKSVLGESKFELESFDLYRKYQTTIHSDKYEDVTQQSYKRFLVDSGLVNSSSYGTFHHKYYLHDKLVAVGVLDVIENEGVSSVYFFYDPEYKHLQLGKYSALNEINLTIYLQNKLNGPKKSEWFYYMGFYIDSCQKMSYKADYGPNELLDPFTLKWESFNSAIQIIRKKEQSIPKSHATFTEDPQAENRAKNINLLINVSSGQHRVVALNEVEGLLREAGYTNLVEMLSSFVQLLSAECEDLTVEI